MIKQEIEIKKVDAMGGSKVLGDYTLIKQIGHGALGAVFLAEHRFMKKHFAIKVLPEDLSTDRPFIQRFEEEVGLLATLDHPNIVKIHNISYSEGQYFLVTDCIVDGDGETTNLAQYILGRSAPLKEEELYRLLEQLASALDYAHHMKGHGKGIIHRGIKLNNILVGKGKDGVHLLLSDFGLSRIMGSGTFLTRTFRAVSEAMGVAKGSVDLEKLSPLHTSFLQGFNFLAPEQKRIGSSEAIDLKSDVYAFGVLAYFLIMGYLPEGYFEMPSEKQKITWNWDGLIKQCLSREPKNRPEFLLPALEAIKVSAQASMKNPLAEALLTPANADMSTLRPVIHRETIERPTVDPDPASIFQIDTSVKHYIPEEKIIKHVDPIPTEMVIIKGGTFWRGSDAGSRDELPGHKVTISSFAIDAHPVTNEQFVRFLEVMGAVKDSNHNDIIRLRDSRINSSAGKFNIESGYLKHPVVGVTWYGAVAYAKWVGKRLPTEAEWEIAARGGLENALYPTGEDIEKPQANFFSSDTLAVMSYAPNGYELYDMAGNVYEWCQDWYGYNYYETSVQEPINPKGPRQGEYRVLRGGCWKSLKDDLRCSRRHRNNPGTVNSTYGFRCAADVE
jgi:formylglycine-generating enzyme required for sulfatase activity